MPKCPYCGFDHDSESVYAEGAPCGVDGCMVYNCCEEAWKEHCKTAHPDYYNKRIDK